MPEGQGRALDEEERRERLRLQDHLGVDQAHKLIRKWMRRTRRANDSQKLDYVLDLANTGKDVGRTAPTASCK